MKRRFRQVNNRSLLHSIKLLERNSFDEVVIDLGTSRSLFFLLGSGRHRIIMKRTVYASVLLDSGIMCFLVS